ncbi:leucine-rich repeat-containing protein 73-like [Watersipora subatra]|uniref:leucine-rich repeat-containing protein 73-like n=1 Tax=Watersipora subatra TaxID=2589382 RepID=UPI00355AE73E
MYFGAVQICGERVGTAETKDFCEALDAHKIKMLSLRECGISTKNFKKITDSLAYCQSILHLNLNLCGIQCDDRVEMLAAALNMNRSLTALLLHGNHFFSEGVCKLVRPLILHPQLSCLDVGDCDIGDKGLKNICELLPPEGDKPGLQELVLSGNPRITPRAWEKFSVAVSACSTLRSLYIDFNGIGETAGKMLVVCAAGHKSLNVLDMEACDLSESVGRLLLHLLQRYPTTLSHVLLEENEICDETKYAIRIALGESESEASSSDEGECDMKLKECRSRRPKSRKKPVQCCSSEDEFVCKNKPRKRHHKSKSSADLDSSTRSKCSVSMKKTTRRRKSKDCCKPLKREPVCKSDTSDPCSSMKPSKSVSGKEVSDLEETLAKFKICVREASDSSSEDIKERDESDETCQYKDEEIRFDFPMTSPRMFDDPDMEREYQTLIADSDDSLGNETDLLTPSHVSNSVVGPDEGDSHSDMDEYKSRAEAVFGRRKTSKYVFS